MAYYLSVIKDNPVGFWKLDESSGNIAYDRSGCLNDGSYTGTILKSGMPLVANGIYGTKITNSNYVSFTISRDFSSNIGIGGFATSSSADNDFSLEVWFYPENITSLTPIFANSAGTGIYWDNGNIVFKIESERLDYTVPNKNKSFHVVGTYGVNGVSLFVDGELVKSKKLYQFSFTNTSLTYSCGPSNSNETFVVDAPAIYRNSLNPRQISNHYYSSITNSESQIVMTDFGQIFKSTDKHQTISDKFVYPAQKSWQYFTSEDLSYKESNNSIYLNKNGEASFYQILTLITWKNYISSKIEWIGSNGVKVYVCTDMDDNYQGSWQECTNGSAIPEFIQGSNFSENKIVFIKTTFTSSDIQKYVPELYYLGIYFYTEKKLFCHNGGGVISTLPLSNRNTWEVDFSNREDYILSRKYDDGIRAKDSPFYLETIDSVRNLEMIFNTSNLSSGYLVYNKTSGTEYSLSWNSSGDISKQNIQNLYINGVDVSSATNISQLLYLNSPNYILIKLSNPISGYIWFNGKVDQGIASGILPNNLYKNIAIYLQEFIDHYLHYKLYIGKDLIVAYGSDISISEKEHIVNSDTWKAVKIFSEDRVVVNNA